MNRKSNGIWLAILGILCCTHGAVGGPATPQSLEATRCSLPPTVDGLVNDECWTGASPLREMYVYGGEPGQTTDGTEVRVLFDDTWLYLAFECKHPDPTTIEQSISHHDGDVCRDDSIEIFLKPVADNGLYYHFMLNLAGVGAERMITESGGKDLGWYVPWLSATHMTDTGWTAEIAVPLFILDQGHGFKDLRINLGRNQVVSQFNEGAVKIGSRRGMSSSAPIEKSFHETDRYNPLKGLEKLDVKTPLLPEIQRTECGRYVLVDGRYSYDVSVLLKGYTDVTGKLLVSVTDHTASGESTTTTKEVELKGKESRMIDIRAPVSSLVERNVEVSVIDVASDTVLQKVSVADTSCLTVMSMPVMDRNYYTSEKDAIALCRLGLPSGDLSNMMIVARGPDGKDVLSSAKDVRTETELKIPLAHLPVGKSSIPIELKRKTGETLFSCKVELEKKTPKPGCEVKIDPVTKVVLKDGKPFFPMGFLAYKIRSDQEHVFKQMSAGGFNAIVCWNYSCKDVGEARAFVEMAAKYGLCVVANPSGFGKHALVSMKDGFKRARTSHIPRSEKMDMFVNAVRENMPPAIEAVNNVKNEKNLLAYFSIDEPHPPVFDIVIEGCRMLYEMYNEQDGYHPTWILYGSGGFMPATSKATDYCDIIAVDPYWSVAGKGIFGSPNVVSMLAARMKRRCDSVNKPMWIVPTAELWSGTYKRATSPGEQRAQTYLAVIHGAKGLCYFIYPVLHEDNWAELSKLAREIRVLAPSILTREIPQRITYSPGGSDIAGGNCPDIQVKLFKNPDGGYVLMAANSARYPVDVVYSVVGLPKVDKVGGLFSKKQYGVENDSFADHLEPLDSRAYALKIDEVLHEPVEIGVKMESHPELEVPEAIIPLTGVPGKKNIAQNPGFEDASLPSWPDYYLPALVWPKIGPKTGEWGQDTTEPYEGKCCLRMKSTLRKSTLRSGFRLKIAPPGDGPYVYSVYLKADREGMEARLGLHGENFPLTTTWKRYWIKNRGEFWLITEGEGVVWADAVQVEKGDTPTEFSR